MNQTGRVGKEGAECTGQVKLGKQVRMFAESSTSFVPKNQMNRSLPTPRIVLPSNGSSTSSSICLSVPSFMSFSVKISDGTSSLTISPSSSDFASHLSHGNVTVSEP